MPITKAAKKALRQTKSRGAINRRIKNNLKDITRTVNDLVKAGKSEEAMKELGKLYKTLDKAAKKHVITKNTAGRRKSRITKAVNKSKTTAKKVESK